MNANFKNITVAVMTVGRQVKTFVAAAGVVTAIVLTQVDTASILIFTFIVVYMFIDTQLLIKI